MITCRRFTVISYGLTSNDALQSSCEPYGLTKHLNKETESLVQRPLSVGCSITTPP